MLVVGFYCREGVYHCVYMIGMWNTSLQAKKPQTYPPTDTNLNQSGSEAFAPTKNELQDLFRSSGLPFAWDLENADSVQNWLNQYWQS